MQYMVTMCEKVFTMARFLTRMGVVIIFEKLV